MGTLYLMLTVFDILYGHDNPYLKLKPTFGFKKGYKYMLGQCVHCD